MKRINIAELLKDCPNGMELDCTMVDGVEFDHIDVKSRYPIACRVKLRNGGYNIYRFNQYGHWNDYFNAKCVIFPKGKTTWEGFQKPFKDGDILSYQFAGFENRSIYIYMYHPRMNTTYYVAVSGGPNSEFMINDKEGHALNSYNDTVRLATEEEKQKLFDTIKNHGYKWNADTKTLEKLIKPKFKVGDRIKHRLTGEVYMVMFVISNGDEGGVYDVAITNEIGKSIDIKEQDNYELAKFDITTLKPFESKVLVRDYDSQIWIPAFFGKYLEDDSNCRYLTTNGCYKYCIPYKGNEYLLGTINDCNVYYKTWE